MEYETKSHRDGLALLNLEPHKTLWDELIETTVGITDDCLRKEHEKFCSTKKQLSVAINNLYDKRLTKLGWTRQPALFNNPEYLKKNETRWRLDFGKKSVAVEIAFNHGEAIAWNLLKPTLAAERNHIEKGDGVKEAQYGVIICATNEMKKAGQFDGAVGTYEKFIRYLNPMMHQLVIPTVLIGLKAPKTIKLKNNGIGHVPRSTVIDI